VSTTIRSWVVLALKIDCTSPKTKSRLRLQAAVSLLHLSTVAIYANSISADFIWLAITVQVTAHPTTMLSDSHETLQQDPCFQVRMAFLTKLIALLTPRKLAPRFNVIPFLTVLDPEPEVKNAVSSRLF
jgi:sister chromatid cohesion protein PDS5